MDSCSQKTRSKNIIQRSHHRWNVPSLTPGTKHVKAQTSGLPKNVSTMRRSEELPIDSIDSTFSIESHMAEVGAASLRVQGMLPGTQIFTRPWDTCTLRGRAIAGTKRVIDEQHPEVLQRVQPRISQFRCLLHKGESCRLCAMKDDAPGRHVRQLSATDASAPGTRSAGVTATRVELASQRARPPQSSGRYGCVQCLFACFKDSWDWNHSLYTEGVPATS